ASAGGQDAYVRKLDPHGTIVWTRQFGTSSDDQAGSVAVDGTGNVYVGRTTYETLAGTNAKKDDAFLRKLDASGATLWTRQFGSAGSESVSAVAVDGSGNVHVAGTTYPTGQSSGDALVRKFDAN